MLSDKSTPGSCNSQIGKTKMNTNKSGNSNLIIYTHTHCHVSHMAKAEFTRDSIAYKEIDISIVRGAFRELEGLTGGQRVTPVIVEGDKITIGYGGMS